MNRFLLYLMVILYVFAGINHFWHPSIYLKIIPPFFANPLLINYLAGGLEIMLGTAIAFSVTRKFGAYGIVLMLFAFIPSHVYFLQQKMNSISFSLAGFLIGWIRLFIVHPLLVIWAWHCRKIKPRLIAGPL